jgi:hypothetical protein
MCSPVINSVQHLDDFVPLEYSFAIWFSDWTPNVLNCQVGGEAPHKINISNWQSTPQTPKRPYISQSWRTQNCAFELHTSRSGLFVSRVNLPKICSFMKCTLLFGWIFWSYLKVEVHMQVLRTFVGCKNTLCISIVNVRHECIFPPWHKIMH